MPDCAKKEDCPRAVIMGCEKCEHYITPEHHELIKKASNSFYKGFVAGVVFSVILVAIIVYC